MARPFRIEYPGAHYPITSRGNEQKDIFKSQRDREKFKEYQESATAPLRSRTTCILPDEQPLRSIAGNAEVNLSQTMRHIDCA